MPFRKILVGLDGSPLSWRALRRALDIARQEHSQVWAVSVEELPRIPADVGEVQDEEIRQGEIFGRIHGEARELADAEHVTLQCVIAKGSPGHLLVEYAAESAVDLIVIGHRGARPWHRLLGSTAEHVIDHAPCAVLIERPRFEDRFEIGHLIEEIQRS